MRVEQTTYHTEQELWRAFLAGDRNAFAQLFEKYADAMYAYGRKMTADAELVKDTMQDVFVKLYDQRYRLKETECVKGYLLVVMKRALLNKFHERTMLPIEEDGEVQFEIELISQSEFEDDSSVYDEEMKLKLARALKELSSRQREAIYLYYIQEIPLTDLPEILGMNYQSTRNLLHRALTKLRQYMGAATSSASMYLFLFQYLSR